MQILLIFCKKRETHFGIITITPSKQRIHAFTAVTDTEFNRNRHWDAKRCLFHHFKLCLFTLEIGYFGNAQKQIFSISGFNTVFLVTGPTFVYRHSGAHRFGNRNGGFCTNDIPDFPERSFLSDQEVLD